MAVPAIQLFVARAQAADASFELSPAMRRPSPS